MIFSSIIAHNETRCYPKAIQTALQYLRNNDFAKMQPGVYQIEGNLMYAQVFDTVTGPKEEKRPEAHEKFIDVQFLVSGEELLGIVPDTGCWEEEERIAERDLIFFKSVENESFLHAYPGSYSIFFPNDIHRPAVMYHKPAQIRKVVVKVSLELL